jgi:hypothetical protein
MADKKISELNAYTPPLAADLFAIVDTAGGETKKITWANVRKTANTKRVATTTSDTTAEINVETTDVYELSAVADATEFTLTGTPLDGQTLMIRLKDAGAGKGLTWTGFTAIGVTLPTTTVASKWHYIGCQYNSAASAWHVLAVGQEA